MRKRWFWALGVLLAMVESFETAALASPLTQAAPPEEITITLRHAKWVPWNSMVARLTIDGKPNAVTVTASSRDGKLAALQVSIALPSRRMKLKVPAGLLEAISDPLFDRVSITATSNNSAAEPLLLVVYMQYGEPFDRDRLGCQDRPRDDYVFATASFGFDTENKTVSRYLRDVCGNVVDESEDVRLIR